MIRCMDKNVVDVGNHQSPCPWFKGKNAPLGVMLLLEGERQYRWVEYSLVSYEPA